MANDKTSVSLSSRNVHGSNLSMAFGAMIYAATLVSCDSERPETTWVPLEVSVTEAVDRDFEDIRRSRVLRMITEYGPGTYYIDSGNQTGFEYELVRSFARQHDLALEVIIPGEGQSPYDLLNSGEGDLIASQYSVSLEREEVVTFTRPYASSDLLLVFSPGVGLYPSSLEETAEQGLPISVRRNSVHYEVLHREVETGLDLAIELLDDAMTPERVLMALSDGEIQAAVVDDHIFEALQGNFPELVSGPVLSRGHEKAWAVRSNSSTLLTELNRFLYRHYRLTGQQTDAKRSTFLTVLHRRFFGRNGTIASMFDASGERRHEIIASPFDDLVRSVADSAEIDWMMVTALISQESNFIPESKSWAGAVGLMQVIPRFSRETYEDLYDPEINVREGVRILKEHYDHYGYLPDEQTRWAFALATYNAGLGHMADARRLAIDMNKDPNSWEDVADALLKLMQKRYNEHARYGYVRGIETVKYVNEIQNRLLTYRAVFSELPEGEMLTQR